MHSILKAIFLTLFSFCLIQQTIAQSADSLVYLFQAVGEFERPVTSFDSADFFRVIPPFQSEQALVEVREFYKNGHLKSAGNCKPETIELKYGKGNYDGVFVAYYPNGKRRIITNYSNGTKHGFEYKFYPNGSPSTVLQHKIHYREFSDYVTTIVDFYDKDGKQICAAGTGAAIIYDDNFRVLLKGPVQNGKMNGDWEGFPQGMNGTKFKFIYKNNVYQSGVGYDSTGKSYAFKIPYIKAQPAINLVDFVAKFRKKLVLPKTLQVTKQTIDSTQIYFEVEPDGKCSNFETISPVSEGFLSALKQAMEQCPKWKPALVYGIPLTTPVAISLNIKVIGVNYRRGHFWNTFSYQEVDSYQKALYGGAELEPMAATPKNFD